MYLDNFYFVSLNDMLRDLPFNVILTQVMNLPHIFKKV